MGFDKMKHDISKLIGLKYIPTLGSDDLDNRDKIKSPERTKYTQIIKHAFSKNNSKHLRKALNRKSHRVILEIGVNNSRSYSYSSTANFMDYVKNNENCVYIGVDINQDNLDEVKDSNKKLHESKKIFFLNTSSSNYDDVTNFIKSVTGEAQIDFLMIDGWHSVNQVLLEWKYVNILKKQGTIFLHDTNNHPGPKELIKALDENVFEIRQPFAGRYDDWGSADITFK